jgi:hypothetical protein
MPVYVGIFAEKGKVMESDSDALSYAFEQCGIEPIEDYSSVEPEFKQMLLDWYYSGNWTKYAREEWRNAEHERIN